MPGSKSAVDGSIPSVMSRAEKAHAQRRGNASAIVGKLEGKPGPAWLGRCRQDGRPSGSSTGAKHGFRESLEPAGKFTLLIAALSWFLEFRAREQARQDAVKAKHYRFAGFVGRFFARQRVEADLDGRARFRTAPRP